MTVSQLCVVAIADTLEELRRQRDVAVDADLVELRLDRLAAGQLDVAGALAGRRTPVIVTCRPRWEGGHFEGSEEERRGILAQALALGAEYVDVEWQAGFTDLIESADRARIVLSSHDFTGVPDDLEARAQAIRATGVGTIKLAAMTHSLADTVRVFEAAGRLRAEGAPARPSPGLRTIFIAMGPCGEISRICPARFGSAWTYAGAIAGIGQLGPEQLLGAYRFRAQTAETRLFGILGRPVGHSVSPAMHNAAFRASGIDGVYLALPAVDVNDFVTFARAFDVAGASVTIPYKVAIQGHVDAVQPLAAQVGAVNTLKMDGSRWEAANTDVAGFLRPLHDRGVELRGIRAAVAGAGGSARAVIAGLVAEGAHVTVHARDGERARAVVAQALAAADPRVGGAVTAGTWPVPDGSWDLLVNCTPLGMYPHAEASPVTSGALTGRVVYDLVYNPLETRLLADAAQAGCVAIGGLDMLVAQAQDQFEWWTGTRPEAAVMRAAALARLAEFRAS